MIVCATRDICVSVYDALRELRPEWHSDEVDKGSMKIVFSSDSRKDPERLRTHALRGSQRKAVINRAKDPDDALELLIVNNMLLTGFDAPPIHTMYLDRPLKGANLMQALARVNRRFRSKQDGLLVGYAPLTENLQRAIAEYSNPTRKTGRSVRTSTGRWTSCATSTRSSTASCTAGTGAAVSPSPPSGRSSKRPSAPRTTSATRALPATTRRRSTTPTRP